MMRRLRRLTTLSRGELAELLGAQWALLHAQALHWIRPVGALVSPVAVAPPQENSAPDNAAAEAAARLALAVARAAENGIFRPACLVRAIALTRMLEARGIHGSQLRVGVRWDGERFAAHAWVEYQGHVLGDREGHVTAYTPLSDVRVLPGPY